MSTFTRTIWLLAALLTTPLAQALGLGGIAGNGAIGEPLDAYVPLYVAPGERATLQSVEVLPDMFARDESNTVSTLRATLEFETGNAYVHVTSNAPLRIERLQFRLRVNTTRGAAIGRYAVRALSPSQRALTTTSDGPRATARDTTPGIVARPASIVAAPSTAGGRTYGPVRSGESLWTIARQFANGNGVQSIMQTLHRLNPQAFVGGDIDRLRAGVMLSLPDDYAVTRVEVTTRTSVTSETPESSMTRASESTTATADTEIDTTPAVDELDAVLDDSTSDMTSGSDSATTDAASTSSTIPTPTDNATAALTPTVANAELAQELDALDAKFAAIRAKYGKQHATSDASTVSLPAPVAKPTPTSTASTPSTLAAAPVAAIAEAAPDAVERPRHTAPGTVESATKPAPATGSNTSLPIWLPKAALAALLLGALLASLPQINRQLVGLRTRTTVATVKAADADRKAEVARKAENRVRLESEIQGLLKRKQAPPVAAAAVAVSDASSASVATHPPVSPYEQTLDALAITSGSALLENDREVAIDANIAHGRYAEAEALLLEVIRAHPRNVQAKLRLAEVYYITEKLDGFASVATDMKDHHRGDMTDEEWQRVVRMGKIIAPDLALFSGPKAVGKRA